MVFYTIGTDGIPPSSFPWRNNGFKPEVAAHMLGLYCSRSPRMAYSAELALSDESSEFVGKGNRFEGGIREGPTRRQSVLCDRTLEPTQFKRYVSTMRERRAHAAKVARPTHDTKRRGEIRAVSILYTPLQTARLWQRYTQDWLIWRSQI